jgi:hypothetical protein
VRFVLAEFFRSLLDRPNCTTTLRVWTENCQLSLFQPADRASHAGPYSARFSYPPTYWQIFFIRPTSDCFAIDNPSIAICLSEAFPIS